MFFVSRTRETLLLFGTPLAKGNENARCAVHLQPPDPEKIMQQHEAMNCLDNEMRYGNEKHEMCCTPSTAWPRKNMQQHGTMKCLGDEMRHISYLLYGWIRVPGSGA